MWRGFDEAIFRACAGVNPVVEAAVAVVDVAVAAALPPRRGWNPRFLGSVGADDSCGGDDRDVD